MKRWIGIFLTVCCLFGMQMTVYGETRIDKVAVIFSYDKEAMRLGMSGLR